MPITGWWCGICKRSVPLNHFETCTYCHPDFAEAILADRAAQADITGVRVSMASSCPRKAAIEQAEDVAVDPLSYLAAVRGTAWHNLMESTVFRSRLLGCEGYNFDGELPAIGAEIEVAGTIAGLSITGRIDRVLLRAGKLVGQDHKTGKDSREVFIRGGRSYGKQVVGSGAPVEYKVQLSLYAELYHQQFKRRWDAAEIWWTFSASHWCEPIEIMPVEQCLAHHPYDCDFTVEQLLHQASVSGAMRWQDLPMAGQSIKFGAKIGCDYCAVRDTCWTAASGAPF